jgi:excisionase family DNA binding protein
MAVPVNPDLPRFKSPAGLAGVANVHVQTIYRLIYSKKLEAVKIGRRWRVPNDAAEALLAGEL